MFKNGLAIVGGLAILGAFAVKAVNVITSNIKVSASSPSLDFTNYSSYLGNSIIPLDVTVTIENSNPFPLGIQNFFGVVKYGSITLSNVSIPYGLYIPSNSVQSFLLNVDLPIEKIINDIASQNNIWNAILNRIELSGTVRVGARGYNINIPLDRIAIPIV